MNPAQPAPQDETTPEFAALIFRARAARNRDLLYSANAYRNEAVTILTTRLTKRVESLAFRHHIDADELNSVLHEKAWRLAEQFIDGDRELPNNLAAYAKRVAQFTAISLQRSDFSENRMRKTLLENATTEVWFGAAIDSTASDLDDVRWILDGLSESDQLVLCLPVMGFDDYEIGQLLGGALPNAIHKRRSDARNRARLRREQLTSYSSDNTNSTGQDTNA